MLTVEHETWLINRGIDLELAVRLGLETVEQNWNGKRHPVISVPYIQNQRVVNHKYRWLDHPDDIGWTQDKGAIQGFWNQDAITDKTLARHPIVITEGEWDAIIALQCGFSRVASVPNGAGTNLDLAATLQPAISNCRRIVLAGDNDDTGLRLVSELARRFGAARCYRPVYPAGCKDLNDVYLKHGSEAVKGIIDGAQPYPIPGICKLSQFAPVDVPELFVTGFPSLNPNLRLWVGEFMVITGIPSHGKSRYAIELVGNLNQRHGHKSFVASFEMDINPYVRDILRENYHGIRCAQQTEEQKTEADGWIEDNIYFANHDPREEEEDASLEWYIDRAGDAVFRHGVRWFLLDPWNQVEHKRGKYENEVDYHLRSIRSMKRFAKQYQCGVIVVTHPTKVVQMATGKVRVPTLYDVSGSAHWYNACDHGLVVWADDLRSTTRTIDVQKVRYREAGLPGKVDLQLRGRLRSIVNGATSEGEDSHVI